MIIFRHVDLVVLYTAPNSWLGRNSRRSAVYDANTCIYWNYSKSCTDLTDIISERKVLGRRKVTRHNFRFMGTFIRSLPHEIFSALCLGEKEPTGRHVFRPCNFTFTNFTKPFRWSVGQPRIVINCGTFSVSAGPLVFEVA
jgi:hypothetical protein